MTPDLPLWAQARDEAIARADENATIDWKSRALIAVHTVALNSPTFICDAVWQHIEKPREPRALGGVLKRAVALGWITKSAEYQPSEQDATHGNPRPKYVSHLYERAA